MSEQKFQFIWSSGCGRIELPLSYSEVDSFNPQGDAEPYVMSIIDEVGPRLDKYSHEIMAAVLREYGEWDEVELLDTKLTKMRLIWIALCDCYESPPTHLNFDPSYMAEIMMSATTPELRDFISGLGVDFFDSELSDKDNMHAKMVSDYNEIFAERFAAYTSLELNPKTCALYDDVIDTTTCLFLCKLKALEISREIDQLADMLGGYEVLSEIIGQSSSNVVELFKEASEAI